MQILYWVILFRYWERHMERTFNSIQMFDRLTPQIIKFWLYIKYEMRRGLLFRDFQCHSKKPSQLVYLLSILKRHNWLYNRSCSHKTTMGILIWWDKRENPYFNIKLPFPASDFYSFSWHVHNVLLLLLYKRIVKNVFEFFSMHFFYLNTANSSFCLF